jgi:hypothetical protein
MFYPALSFVACSAEQMKASVMQYQLLLQSDVFFGFVMVVTFMGWLFCDYLLAGTRADAKRASFATF